MGTHCTIITSEKYSLTDDNLGLDTGDTNKSLLPVSYNKDTNPKSEYNPELDNTYYNIYIYRLYLYRYSLDIELYRLR
jgi:hypothetical protein